MSEAVKRLEDYTTAMQFAFASFYVYKGCCGERDNERKVLEEMKSMYLTNMVNHL